MRRSWETNIQETETTEIGLHPVKRVQSQLMRRQVNYN